MGAAKSSRTIEGTTVSDHRATGSDRLPVSLSWVDGPIDVAGLPQRGVPDAGAVLSFHGIVRPQEHGRGIDGLEYERYEPMSSREMTKLAERHRGTYQVMAVDIWHSHGFVGSGECSFVLRVAGRHRAETIGFVDTFIAEMKRVVPIWKVARESTVASDVGDSY